MFEQPISRRAFGTTVLAASLLGGLSLAGCTSGGTKASPGASGAASVKGGTLTVASDVDLTPLNPAKGAAALGPQMFFAAVYDTLLKIEPDGSAVPNLAEKFEANADKTLFTVTLRDGLKFSDGSPYDAEAFKGYIEATKAGGGPGSKDAAPLTVTVKDARTFEIASKAPNGLLPQLLAGALGVVPSPKQLASADADTAPIGAGPYTYDKAKSTSGNSYTLVKNPNHPNAAAYPYDTVVIKVLSDATARLNALNSGQVNGAAIQATQGKAVEGAGHTLLKQPGNFSGMILADREGKLVPALGNLKVRQAINHAFDRQAILTSTLSGFGKVTNQIFPEGTAGYVAELKDAYPYDLEKAKALMKEAGFENGFTVEIPAIDGITPYNAIIVSQLKQIGITVTEVKVPIQQAFAQVLGGKFAIIPGVGTSTPLQMVNEMVAPGGVWNVLHQTTPELAGLCDKAQKATGDEAKATFQAIGKYLVDNAWFCPWNIADQLYAVDSKTTAEVRVGASYPPVRTFKPKA